MDPHQQLTPHFNLYEFLHNGSTEGLTLDALNTLRKLAQRLEEARVLLGNKPIHINSGFRTPEHNRAVGGVKGSQHLYGRAADITVVGMTPSQVHSILKDWQGGMGYYPPTEKRAGWIHLDIRPAKERWVG